MEKMCCVCRKLKSPEDFGPCKGTKDGKQYKCMVCNREQAKAHYELNKNKHFELASARKKKIRRAIANIKEAAGCQLCGEKCSLCLDFHHIDGNDKELLISFVSASVNRLRVEISKCEIVCSNCHRKIHGNLVKLGPRRDIDVSWL